MEANSAEGIRVKIASHSGIIDDEPFDSLHPDFYPAITVREGYRR